MDKIDIQRRLQEQIDAQHRLQEKIDIQHRLQEFQRQRLEDRGQEVYIPLEAKASRQAPDDAPFSLMENFKDFLNCDQEVLLILGDSRTGKSTFNRELEWELWDAYDKDKARIPILVWLPAIDEPEKDIIAQRLRASDFNEDEIRELKDHYKFVLICDGYDESQLTYNLYNTNKLNTAGQWQAKMVISCRSEYLGHDYRRHFQPGDYNDWMGGALLREAVIAPFTRSKIQGYVKKYVEKYTSMNEISWKVENYLSVIEGVPGFQELVSNPLLLKLSLEVLPEIMGRNDLSSVKVTRVTLHDKYVENWIKEQDKERLIGSSSFNEGGKRAFKFMPDHDFKQNVIDFMKNLAVAISDHQDGNIIINMEWHELFLSLEGGKKKWEQD
ncbi:WD_REPEATS_REGION domain-containing protein [Dissophora globulifera]|nr:WD_REPEATS_REGION domain-containing protein [Dissophora globulifera]